MSNTHLESNMAPTLLAGCGGGANVVSAVTYSQACNSADCESLLGESSAFDAALGAAQSTAIGQKSFHKKRHGVCSSKFVVALCLGLVSFVFLTFSVACSEPDEVVCFSDPLRGDVVCAKVPGGTICTYDALRSEMRCVGDNNELFVPDTYRLS